MANYLGTMKGTLQAATLQEIFVHTVGIISTSSATTLAQDLAETWDDALKDPQGRFSNSLAPGVSYTGVAVAPILDLVEGKLAAATHYDYPAPLNGTGSGNLPAQCSIAVSWRAGTRANGTPLRGRMYLPSPATSALSSSAGGRLDPSTVTQIADNMAGWVQAMLTRGHGVAVWSRKEGRLAMVRDVRVGDQVDTIRSRRNAGQETYALRNIVLA